METTGLLHMVYMHVYGMCLAKLALVYKCVDSCTLDVILLIIYFEYSRACIYSLVPDLTR